LNVKGIPSFEDSIKNEWEFKLNDRLLDLKIKAGAYVGKYDLGGLSLRNLEISDGASDVTLTFSEPNQVEMDTFQYYTGASDVNLKNLANANFSIMSFRCGAGTYTLDFNGELQRDATVSIESGIGSLYIIIPENVPAQVVVEGGMSNVDYEGEWEKEGSTYIQKGEGPALKIIIKIGAGSLELRNK
jgi:hypothetical protein